jgi:hypothetical protein
MFYFIFPFKEQRVLLNKKENKFCRKFHFHNFFSLTKLFVKGCLNYVENISNQQPDSQMAAQTTAWAKEYKKCCSTTLNTEFQYILDKVHE